MAAQVCSIDQADGEVSGGPVALEPETQAIIVGLFARRIARRQHFAAHCRMVADAFGSDQMRTAAVAGRQRWVGMVRVRVASRGSRFGGARSTRCPALARALRDGVEGADGIQR
jgi:hypothetical protein